MTPTLEVCSAKLAIAVEDSKNDKTGVMSCTYTGYQTCSDDCELKPLIEAGDFKSSPCYASCDLVGMHMHRLTKASVDVPLIQIQKQEVQGIRGLTGKRILRLKVGGDTPNNEYAADLAEACQEHTAKHGMPAYGYTHSWRDIDRASFGQVSMLASCDSVSDIPLAKSKGYATATVVSEFPNGAKLFTIDGEVLLPCPNQINKAIQCTDCLLCTKDGLLRARGFTVAFKAHGRKAADLAATQAEKGQ